MLVCDLQEDPDTIDRLIVDAEASYNKWRHPDPYIGKQITHPLKINLWINIVFCFSFSDFFI